MGCGPTVPPLPTTPDPARGPHQDAIFANDRGEWGMSGSCVRFNGPAGPFTFYVKNATFAGNVGDAALSAGQHCGLDQGWAGTQVTSDWAG